MQHEDGFVTLVTERGCAGVSFNGVWYPASNDRVRVPAHSVPELTRKIHGNRLATADDEAKAVPTLAQTLHLKQGKRA